MRIQLPADLRNEFLETELEKTNIEGSKTYFSLDFSDLRT